MATRKFQFETMTAAGKKSVFDMSFNHIGTQDFGYLKPIGMNFLVPGDEWKINITQFTRLMPMPCPTFGKVDTRIRAFFVPFQTILNGWNDFIANRVSPSTGGEIAIPHVTNEWFTNWFVKKNAFILEDQDLPLYQEGSWDYYDIIVRENDGLWHGLNLTPLGKRFYDMLLGCGINIQMCAYKSTTEEAYTEIAQRKFSVLPIAGLYRWYTDWIVPSRFVDEYMPIRMLFVANEWSGEELFTAMDQIYNVNPAALVLSTFYADDMFSCAFKNPFGLENQSMYDYNIQNPAIYSSEGTHMLGAEAITSIDPTLQAAKQGARIKRGEGEPSNGSTWGINHFTIKSLGVLQDLLNRGKIAGTKIQDYLWETYGIKANSDELNLSLYLGSSQDIIKIGDVMATAGTEVNELGQFAGKGIGSMRFGCTCKSGNKHGLLYLCSEINVDPSYYQGEKPEMRQLERDDFYQPEFDNLGVEAISKAQIKAEWDNNGMNMYGYPIDSPDSIFGFTPRYSKYKFNNDIISGDFRLQSSRTLRSWYLSRNLEYATKGTWTNINSNFCRQLVDIEINNYDYMFNAANNNSDHFYNVFSVGIKALRPMETISKALETEDTNDMGRKVRVSMN
ncbi:major capsid protein [Capybara microvirus Cap1_SP_60]|nr:major capsid protein [Capybara microvirus Cap1_SP_60]